MNGAGRNVQAPPVAHAGSQRLAVSQTHERLLRQVDCGGGLCILKAEHIHCSCLIKNVLCTANHNKAIQIAGYDEYRAGPTPRLPAGRSAARCAGWRACRPPSMWLSACSRTLLTAATPLLPAGKADACRSRMSARTMVDYIGQWTCRCVSRCACCRRQMAVVAAGLPRSPNKRTEPAATRYSP